MAEDLKVIQAAVGDVHEDIVRVEISHRKGTRAGHVVKVCVNGKSAYCVARGMRANKSGVISLDSASRAKLGLEDGRSYSFEISKATFCGEICWAWNATAAMPRIAARLAVLSVALGLIGFLLGIISLCK